MAVADLSGNLLEVNDALCSLAGVRPGDLDAVSLFGTDFSLELAERMAAGTEQPGEAISTVVFEREFSTTGGQRLTARVSVAALRDGDREPVRLLIQFEDISEGRAGADVMARDKSTDPLTGLASRALFYDRLEQALSAPRRSGRRMAVLVINLNRFQQVNAGLGHRAADLILGQVAIRLTSATKETDTVARLGGDWFAVFAPSVRSSVDAIALAVNLRQALGEPYWAAGNAVYVSARVGVVTAPTDGTDAATLLRRATVATNLAKTHASGWAIPVAGTDTVTREELRLVSDLQTAIEDGQLTVAYQPMVDPQGGVHALEALARWQHPTHGVVAPDQFIVLAEQYGLIAALTTRILTSAVEQALEWSPAGTVAIAVNLSGKLLTNPSLVDEIMSVLAAAHLPPAALTLEITETALADGGDPVVRGALAALRRAGIRISVDDFGTGYSSLAYLKDLPVDQLKIDRSFVIDLVTNERADRVVRSIIDLAHSLELEVVAEGVEHEAVADHLLRRGVDFLQGYAIARPAPVDAITDWLGNRRGTSPAVRDLANDRRRLNVLIVDDEVATRAALRARLADLRHRVVEARSSSAALDKLKKRMPDVVILDHLLPGVTGVDTVPQLREAGYVGPILLYSDAPPEDLAAIRLPLDVWPVSKVDEPTFMKLIDGYARIPRPKNGKDHVGSPGTPGTLAP